jgi:subtilisin family serine protease
MSSVRSALLLFVLALFCAGALAGTPASHPSRLIVTLKDGYDSLIDDSKFRSLDDLGLAVYQKYPALDGHAKLVSYTIKDRVSVDVKIKLLKTFAAVKAVENDYKVGTKYADGGSSTNLYGLDKVRAQCAWDKFTMGNPLVKVCVTDTGLDYKHKDIAANAWVNAKEGGGVSGKDDDGNGYVDDVYGWNVITKTGNVYDDHGHGTHVAGTIAAVRNFAGAVGVSQTVKVLPCKFLDRYGSGWTSDAIACISFCKAVFNKDRASGGQLTGIYSNSWGGGGYSSSLYTAIKAADTGATRGLFLFAAGNDGSNNDVYPSYPSSYNLANIISVAASDSSDAVPWFTNYGKTSVDLAAPGVGIYSLKPGNLYQYLDGTSMATPHVASVCALLVSRSMSATTEQIKAAVLGGASPVAKWTGKTVTGARLNAVGSLNKLLGTNYNCACY